MTDTTKNPDYKVRYESRDENYTVGIAKQAKRDISKISAADSAEAHDLSQLYGFDQVIRGAEGPYRPDDGAAAFARALVRVFNTDGVGQVTRSFFGDTPPIYKDIQVQELIYRTGDLREITADSLLNIEVWPITDLVNFAISEGVTVISPYSEGDRYPIIGELTDRWEIVGTKIGTAQVPVGKVELGEYGLICDVGSKMEEPWGEVFWLKIVAPKMQTEVVNELRDAVQDELAKRSIYKGRCLYTSNTGTPAFWDPCRADPPAGAPEPDRPRGPRRPQQHERGEEVGRLARLPQVGVRRRLRHRQDPGHEHRCTGGDAERHHRGAPQARRPA